MSDVLARGDAGPATLSSMLSLDVCRAYRNAITSLTGESSSWIGFSCVLELIPFNGGLKHARAYVKICKDHLIGSSEETARANTSPGDGRRRRSHSGIIECRVFTKVPTV